MTCLPWEQALKPYTQSALRPEKKGDHQIGSAEGAFSSVAWGVAQELDRNQNKR